MEFENHVPEAVQTLFPSPNLIGLQFLHLRSCQPETLESLSTAPVTRSLRELWVWCGGYGAITPGSGFGTLVSAEWPALESVRFDDCAVGDGEALLLATEFAARGRKSLHLSSYRMTREGVRTAVETVLPGGLDSLSLAHSVDHRKTPTTPPFGARELRIEGYSSDGDWIVGWLAKTVPAGRFDRLGLVNCRISRAGASVLLNWPGLPHLKELDLEGNWIGDSGAVALANSPHLDNLETLYVASNDITKSGKDALKKRFGRRVRIS
jgi:hypothetical protein